MRYKKLGATNLNVSVLGFGTWAIGGDYFGSVKDSESIVAIHAAIDAGINLIDTAPAYGHGHAEEVVGQAIKGKRDKVIVVTKCGTQRIDGKYCRDLKPETVRREVDQSLSRLGVEAIDIYLLHWPDANTPLTDTMQEIAKIKQAGKIKHFGVSNFGLDLIDQISPIVPVECVQPHFSLLFRDREELVAACHAQGLGVMTYGSLAGGLLSGKFRERPQLEENDSRNVFYAFFRDPLWDKSVALIEELRKIADQRNRPVAHVALNWVTQSSHVDIALVGAKNARQVRENAASADWELSSEEIFQVNQVYARLFPKI